MDGPPLPRHERLALWASTAAIVLVVAAQAPGRIIPETKLDVTLDPVGYLSRAFSAWDPSGGFGRVQNQAIGYLFPMGAFSAAGHGVGLPPWLVQRLWIGALLAVGLWGAHRVARAVGVSSATGRLVAAWAYALAPATLGVAAFQSAGQLPYAMAPHVLVPLLAARPGESPRRVASRSALWIAAMGGVNGASSFAVLPLVAIWFLTRSPGPARRRLLTWWAGGALLATLWWLIPLLVSVRYGIRFTDFTESASLTTITESSTEVLRGTGNWLAYLTNQSGPWLPGGLAMATSRIAIVGSIGVAGGGLWGLARPKAPGRAWLLPALALGTAAMGVGYVGAWGGPFADASHALLDGPFAPFRNVHKFAAVVRLPLAIGLGHAVTVVAARFGPVARTEAPGPVAVERRRPVALAFTALAPLAIVLSVLPVATELTAPGSFADVPDSWRAAAAWLHRHDDGGRALLVPGSSFGEYRWGRPLDEPLSSLDAGNWAVRDLIPLGGNGSTRLLDGIDEALQGDHLPAGFVSTLQRAGVSYLVVRNDLDIARTEAPRPATVRRLLQTAPAVELVVSFGDLLTEPGSDNRLAYPPGAASSEAYREIEVYRVPAPHRGAAGPRHGPEVASYPQAGAAVVSGGPEALLDLDLSPAQAAVLAVDPGARAITEPTRVVTDTARNRDVEFGAIRDNASYTLAAGERSPTTRKDPVDRWPAGRPVGLTVARLQGAATLTASGRRGELLRPERQPFAAFDHNPTTTWAPSKEQPKGWLEVGWDRAVPVGRVTVHQPDATGRRVRTIRITTDHGSRTARFGADGVASVDPPAGTTRHLRITIESLAAGADLEPAGFSQVDIRGVTIARPLVAPEVQGTGGDAVVLSRSQSDAFSFYRRDEDGRLDRRFSWAGTAAPIASGTADPLPGPALDRLLASVATGTDPGALTATASSRFRDLPALSAAAAADGDPATAWVSAAQATAPSLTLSWTGAVPVDALQITTVDAGVDPLGRVDIHIGGRHYLRRLTSSGQVAIPATTTDRVTLSFPGDAEAGGPEGRQVAIAEVTLPALLGRTTAAPDRSQVVDLTCGDGPDLRLDGRIVSTSARTTVGDLLDAAPVPWTACAPVRLAHGWHRLTADGGPLLVSTATVAAPDAAPPGPARSARATRWDDEHRTIRLGAGPASIIATAENLNDGWGATLDGRRLTAIQVDGWRQGWLVPAGRSGTIDLRYEPGRTQRAGIFVGLAAVAGLLALAIVGPRRAAGWTPPGERSWSVPVVVGIGAIVSLCLAGLPVLAVAALLALRPVRRRLPWIALGAAGAAGAITFVQAGAEIGSTTGTFSGPAQALSAIAVLAVVATGLDRGTATPAAGSTPSSPAPSDHRQPGTSTTPEGSG